MLCKNKQKRDHSDVPAVVWPVLKNATPLREYVWHVCMSLCMCTSVCVCVCVCMLDREGSRVVASSFSSRIDSHVSDQLQWLSDWFPWTTFASLYMSHRYEKCHMQSLHVTTRSHALTPATRQVVLSPVLYVNHALGVRVAKVAVMRRPIVYLQPTNTLLSLDNEKLSDSKINFRRVLLMSLQVLHVALLVSKA